MKCPGQDSRYWQPGAIFETECPRCGTTVEFFKDDTTRACKACGHRFLNPKMDFGCASYCPHAEQCLGSLSPELLAQRENLLKDRVALEMKKFFGRDFKSIAHAMRVARYAEELGKGEKGNLPVIIPAAYLLHVGEGKEVGERSRTVREILMRIKTQDAWADEVCSVIERFHQGKAGEDLDLGIVFDAEGLATLEEEAKKGDTDPRRAPGAHGFLTDTGRRMGEKLG